MRTTSKIITSLEVLSALPWSAMAELYFLYYNVVVLDPGVTQLFHLNSIVFFGVVFLFSSSSCISGVHFYLLGVLKSVTVEDEYIYSS